MHVAIIMRGTGEWAMRRGLPSTAGCAAGVAALRTTVAVAAAARVNTLTVYSLYGSRDGERPAGKMDADLCVVSRFLRGTLWRRPDDAVRVSLIANRPRSSELSLPYSNHNEHLSVAETRLHLRIVIDYSAHDRLTRAASTSYDEGAAGQFFRGVREIDPTALPAGAVDLLVRTGRGLCRSDFMLWEVAYARLHCVERLWPDFTARDFQEALDLDVRHTDSVPVMC